MPGRSCTEHPIEDHSPMVHHMWVIKGGKQMYGIIVLSVYAIIMLSVTVF